MGKEHIKSKVPLRASKKSGLKPMCFMMMPFGSRPVEGEMRVGTPRRLNCDALWDRAFRPVIEELGYVPIRADADTGSAVVNDMLERLAYSHLVLADVTVPNGNVYYGIGLRHAAREARCVLLAASWSKQLFDIERFRSIRYPLKDGDVPEKAPAKIRGQNPGTDIAIELLTLIRDELGWCAILDYIEGLPLTANEFERLQE